MRTDRRTPSTLAVPTALALATLLLALASAPATAMADDGDWSLRAFALWNRPESSTQTGGQVPEYDIAAELDAAPGLGLAVERRLSPQLGVELGLSRSDPRFSLHGTPQVAQLPAFDTAADISTWIATFGLDIHLTPERRIDLWVAPLAALVHTEAFTLRVDELDAEARFGSGDEFAYGAQVGLAIPFNDRSGFYSSLTLLEADLDVAELDQPQGAPGLAAAYDPLMLAVGFSTRF